jgi:ectoine hydroxylase-related dioxygenase (phytanoyl-CoA dioxygenase family)
MSGLEMRTRNLARLRQLTVSPVAIRLRQAPEDVADKLHVHGACIIPRVFNEREVHTLRECKRGFDKIGSTFHGLIQDAFKPLVFPAVKAFNNQSKYGPHLDMVNSFFTEYAALHPEVKEWHLDNLPYNNLTSIVPLIPFGEHNGATQFVPGSAPRLSVPNGHMMLSSTTLEFAAHYKEYFDENMIKFVADSGDVLLLASRRVWHRAGPRTGNAERLSLALRIDRE